MTKLLPFDLAAAKAGAKVVTREGRPARIVCWDRVSGAVGDPYPIVALILNRTGFEEALSFSSLGRFYYDERTHGCDLFMAPTPVKRWRVVYRGEDDNAKQIDFEMRDEAYRLFYSIGQSLPPYEVEVTP